MTRTSSALTIIFFLLLLILLFYIVVIPADKSKNQLGRLVGETLPSFQLPILDSNELLTNQNFSHHQKDFILLNFYASWCRTCEDDHQELMKLAGNSNIAIYGVMSKDNTKKSIEWLEKKGNPYDLIAIDKFGRMKSVFKLIGIPESFLIDHNNIIISHFRGPVDIKIINEITTYKP